MLGNNKRALFFHETVGMVLKKIEKFLCYPKLSFIKMLLNIARSCTAMLLETVKASQSLTELLLFKMITSYTSVFWVEIIAGGIRFRNKTRICYHKLMPSVVVILSISRINLI